MRFLKSQAKCGVSSSFIQAQSINTRSLKLTAQLAQAINPSTLSQFIVSQPSPLFCDTNSRHNDPQRPLKNCPKLQAEHQTFGGSKLFNSYRRLSFTSSSSANLESIHLDNFDPSPKVLLNNKTFPQRSVAGNGKSATKRSRGSRNSCWTCRYHN